ncbi:hypothetical protein ABK040_011958 [Willaertia magna]
MPSRSSFALLGILLLTLCFITFVHSLEISIAKNRDITTSCQIIDNWWNGILGFQHNQYADIYFQMKGDNGLEIIFVEDTSGFYQDNIGPVRVGRLSGNYNLQNLNTENNYILQTNNLQCEMLSNNLTNIDSCVTYLNIFNNINITLNALSSCKEMVFKDIRHFVIDNLHLAKASDTNSLQQNNNCKLDKYFKTSDSFNTIYIDFKSNNNFEITYKKKCTDNTFVQSATLVGAYTYLEKYQIIITKVNSCKNKQSSSHTNEDCPYICSSDSYNPIDIGGVIRWGVSSTDSRDICDSFKLVKKGIVFDLSDSPDQDEITSIIVGVSVGIPLGFVLLISLLGLMICFFCRVDKNEREEKMGIVDKSVNTNRNSYSQQV